MSVSLSRYLVEEQRAKGKIPPELRLLLEVVARALDRWRNLAQPYQHAAAEALKRIAAKTDLSKDVREVVTRALQETNT